MPRYERQEIPQGQEAWVDVVNENFENMFDKPFPPVTYTAPANLPNAAEFTDCVAVAGGNMYLSNGTTWQLISQSGGGMVLLGEVSAVGLNAVDLPYNPAWDIYSNLVVKAEGILPDLARKFGISFYYGAFNYFSIRQHSATSGRYVSQTNTQLSTSLQSNFAVKVSNRLTKYKSIEIFEAGMFQDGGNNTASVQARSNPEAFNTSFSSITTNDDHCVILYSNNGSTAEAFGGFTLAIEAGAVFDEGSLQVWGI